MPSTNYPNGVSCTTTVRTVSGELFCQTLNVSSTATITGTLTVAGTGGVIGQYVTLPYTFASSSAAQTDYVACPVAGNIVQTFITIGTVSAVAAGYTIRVGSAGSVAVATVTNTLTDAGSQEGLTTTSTAITTANGVFVSRGVQGTAGVTAISVVVQRTA